MVRLAYTVCHGGSFRALREGYYRLDKKTLHPPGYGYEVAEWGILDREKFLMWVADTDTETVKAAKN